MGICLTGIVIKVLSESFMSRNWLRHARFTSPQVRGQYRGGGGAGARDSSGEPPQGRPVLDCEGPRPGREPGCGGWPGS